MTVLDRTVEPRAVSSPEARTPTPWRATLGWTVVVLALGAWLVGDPQVPVLRSVAGFVLLLGVPVLVLARRFDPAVAPLRSLLYAVGLTVLGIIGGALALNTALPVLGAEAPLSIVPIAVASTAVDVGLVWWRRSVPLLPARPFRDLMSVTWPPGAVLGVLSVVVAIAGAVRLDNGLGPQVAVAGHVLAGLAILRTATSRRSGTGADAVVLFLASTSLLLATSLRGRFITGHDIQREYIAYLLTQQADRWSMEVFQNAYNACLSINILPTVLSNLTALPGTIVFKVVLQVVFAVVPVVVYLLGRRVASRAAALIAAVVFISFPTFVNDMAYLVRQEVAFVFLGLAVLAAAETAWSWRRRVTVTATFGAGVVLSHYSTTYTLLLALMAGSVLFYGARWIQRRRSAPRRAHLEPSERPVIVHPVVIVLLLGLTWLWTNPATQSSGHFSETVAETVSAIVNGSSDPGSSDLQYGPFAGQQASPQERLDSYSDNALATRTEDPDSYLLPNPDPAQTRPRAVEQPDVPLTSLGRSIDRTGVDTSAVSNALRLGSAFLLQLLVLLGVAAIVFRGRVARRVRGEYKWLALGTIGALAFQVLVPGLSAEYGVLRAFQQALIVLAPVVAIGLLYALGWLGRRRTVVAGVAAGGLFAVLTGVVPTALGGYPGQLALASSGQYHDLYYVTPAEVAGARYLAAAAEDDPGESAVLTDLTSSLRVSGLTGNAVTPTGEFFPTRLRQEGYVFLNRTNVRERRGTVFYTGDLIGYRYPIDLLDRDLDLVYSNGDSRVYR